MTQQGAAAGGMHREVALEDTAKALIGGIVEASS